jgi:hypothetical protein
MSALRHNSHTFVCVPCRVTVRRSEFGSAICAHCHVPMRNVGDKWRAPKKTDKKAWEALARERTDRYPRGKLVIHPNGPGKRGRSKAER